MRFWDSSALVPLFVQQAASPAVLALHAANAEVAAWALSEVEFRSAIWRLVREHALAAADAAELLIRFETLWSGVRVVPLTEPVLVRARRVLAVHALRAADAMQLGAALTIVYDLPAGWEFVCLDQRLSDAARIEGFRVVP